MTPMMARPVARMTLAMVLTSARRPNPAPLFSETWIMRKVARRSKRLRTKAMIAMTISRGSLVWMNSWLS